MTENVRLQNLRDFTVQIRDANDQIVGTGIAVSTDGKIVTCAHVVQAAGIEPRNANGAEVGVYFPQARGGEEKSYRASVEKCFPIHDDDVVLLQISKGASPLAPEQIAVLGMADKSEGNPFRTYGYSPIGDYPATRGDGVILGSIEPPKDRKFLVDPIQLRSRDIAEGMSGAAVLDVNRNLVIGLVAERYFPENNVQDDIGFSVDSKVLRFDPFDFDVRGESLELRPAPEFRIDKDLLAQAIEIANYVVAHRASADKYSWNNVPSILTEWTGRDDLLNQITADWNNPRKHVTGLIGFGGEGKSSLARKWVDTLLTGDTLPPSSGEGTEMGVPDGVFWWGFYENRSVDEFLEAALNYMSSGRIDPRQVQSSNLRAQIIGAMLSAGRYLFVLDGLEVMQHQEGDQYGLLQSNDLRDLLTYFARPDNSSFCLVTSRAPLLDLMEYTTYTHRDVERLSEEDGRALLQKLGVKGDNKELNKVVSDWDGHALTLSILAAYLAERFEGDVKHLADIPAPTADEPRYERVHRVLRRYDEHLTQAEREFLKLFSAFRTPVHEGAFKRVFVPLLSKLTAKNAKDAKKESFFLRALSVLRGSKNEFPITDIVARLVTYRLLRHDAASQTYTAHPLIRNHYLAILTYNTGKANVHLKIKDYYLARPGGILGRVKSFGGSLGIGFPTLDDLKPLIEVVHHACQAGAYDEANEIRRNLIDQDNRRVLGQELGAYETMLSVMTEFFPNRNLNKQPQVSNPHGKSWLLNSVGLCLMNLGRLREAVPFLVRSNAMDAELQYWPYLSTGYQNLAELYAWLGALEASAEAAGQALDLARRAENKEYVRDSLCRKGTTDFLLGDIQTASDSFVQAEKLEHKIDLSKHYLCSLRGIQHADHLRRTGQSDYARRVTEANLQICGRNHWPDDTSKSHRVLGDLDSDVGNHISAHAHYESALKIARSIQQRHILIEALLARGRWAAKYMKDANAAFSDLNEALGYCVESGYRIYEADVRVALGWAYLADLTPGPSPCGRGASLAKAKAEAERALQMSKEMGYHSGKVDAQEVIERIESGE